MKDGSSFSLVGHLGWLQGGGGQRLSRQVVLFHLAGELGPGSILLLLVISRQVQDFSWILALGPPLLQRLNRFHSTSLARG